MTNDKDSAVLAPCPVPWCEHDAAVDALKNPTPELIAAIEAQFQYWKNDSSTNGPMLRACAFCQTISEHLVSPS